MESAASWIGDTLGWLNPGYLTLGLIRPALDLFRSETMAPNLSALMVAAAVALLVGFRRRRVGPACAALDERIAFLKQCRSPSAFYDRIDQFDALMMSVPFLAHGWSEFIEACLFTRREGKVSVEVSIRPGVFISLDEAEHGGLRIRWFHHLSGIFVGLGLLLTFIGLVAALYFSSTAINIVIDGTHGLPAAEQTKAIQRALAQLLNTATFKFLTSIAGLGCSLALACFQREWTARLERKFQELCRELERCTIIVTPEQLANRQHHELTTQSELLRELPHQAAPEFGRALEAALAAALPAMLEQALAPVVDKLDETGRAIVNARQAPLHAMAQEFSATVAASAGREIKAVAETLSGLPLQIAAAAETLTALPERMSAVTDDLQRTLEALSRGMAAFQARIAPPDPPADPLAEALAREIGQALDGLRAGLAALAARPEAGSAAASELSHAAARIEAALHGNATAIAALLEGLRGHAAENGRVLAAVAENGRVLADAAENGRVLAAAAENGRVLAAAAENGRAALADDTARALAALTEAAGRLGASLETALRQGQERSERSAAEIAGRFLDAAEAARAAAGEQSARLEDALAKIAAAGMRAGHEAEAAAETLDRRARDAAGQIAEDSRQALGRFGESADQLSHRIDALGRAMAAIESRIAGHAAALEGVNRAARETETALEASARAVATAAAPLARSGEAIALTTQALARSVETTAETLRESQHQGQSLATDLRETLNRLQTVWTRHENRFADTDESLARILTSIIEHVDAHGGALRDHVVKIDTHLAQTVNNLAGNVEALQQTTEEITKAMIIMQNIVEGVALIQQANIEKRPSDLQGET